VTEKNLEAALAQQRITGNRRLGEILVERGNVTRAQVARLVAEQYDLPFVEIEHSRIQRDATRLLPEGVARRLSAVPLGQADDGSLLVVVSDPTNVVYADELRVALEAPLRFAVADPDGIEAAIDVLYEHSLALAPREDRDEPGHEQESFDEPTAAVALPLEEETSAPGDQLEEHESPAHAEAPPLFDGVPEWEIEDDVLSAVEDLAIAPFDEEPPTIHAEDDPYESDDDTDELDLELEAQPDSEPLAAVEELPAAGAQLDEDLLAEVEEAVDTVAVALVEPEATEDSDDVVDAGAGAVSEPTDEHDD
jgi:hypothetical protein